MHKLSMLSSLFALAALAPSLLPLQVARLAVHCIQAHGAENGHVGLRHDHLLANDANDELVETEALEVLPIANTVIRH